VVERFYHRSMPLDFRTGSGSHRILRSTYIDE